MTKVNIFAFLFIFKSHNQTNLSPSLFLPFLIVTLTLQEQGQRGSGTFLEADWENDRDCRQLPEDDGASCFVQCLPPLWLCGSIF